jgi:exosortase/archaeosortase family protein
LKNTIVRQYLFFIVKFIGIFLLINFTVKFLYGASIKGGYYNAFIEQNLNIVRGIRSALMLSVTWLLNIVNIQTIQVDEFTLRSTQGKGIRLVYECLAIAVHSVWLAYTISYPTAIKQKLKWAFGGFFLIWLLNTIRIALVLYANNNNLSFPFGIDHHTWFNIVAYALLIFLIFAFQKLHPFSSPNSAAKANSNAVSSSS